MSTFLQWTKLPYYLIEKLYDASQVNVYILNQFYINIIGILLSAVAKLLKPEIRMASINQRVRESKG